MGGYSEGGRLKDEGRMEILLVLRILAFNHYLYNRDVSIALGRCKKRVSDGEHGYSFDHCQ